ncbi:GNAT family N-acetyltransferase [candidate division KSB1 bacterium]|nr:GNAT family N-acetyltransferase [candidate division KSB1 bacterium]
MSIAQMSLDYKLRAVDETEFAGMQTVWNALLVQARSHSFFLKWEWLYSYWLSIKNGSNRLAILAVENNADLVGLAPLYCCRRPRLGFPIWKIKFLGEDVASDYLDFIIKPGCERQCVRLFVDELLTSSSFSATGLAGFSQDSILHQYAIPELSRRSSHFLVYPANNCPEIVLPGSEDEFFDQLSSNTRYNLKRREKQLRKEFDHVEFKFIEFNRSDELVDTLFQLHETRWESIEDKASTFNNDFRKDFHRKLNAVLNKDGGFFSLVQVNDKIVSIILIFHFQDNYFFYQNGWEPQFSKFSIGIVHLFHVILYCIQKNGVNFSMLRGDESYKFKFANRSTTLYSIMIFKNNIVGKTTFWITRTMRSCKKIAKRMLGKIESLQRNAPISLSRDAEVAASRSPGIIE